MRDRWWLGDDRFVGRSVIARSGTGVGLVGGIVGGATTGLLLAGPFGALAGVVLGALFSVVPTSLLVGLLVVLARPGTAPDVFTRRARVAMLVPIGLTLGGCAVLTGVFDARSGIEHAAAWVGVVVADLAVATGVVDRTSDLSPRPAGQRDRGWAEAAVLAAAAVALLARAGSEWVWGEEPALRREVAAVRGEVADVLHLELRSTDTTSGGCGNGHRGVGARARGSAPLLDDAGLDRIEAALVADDWDVVERPHLGDAVDTTDGETSVEVSVDGFGTRVAVRRGCGAGIPDGS